MRAIAARAAAAWAASSASTTSRAASEQAPGPRSAWWRGAERGRGPLDAAAAVVISAWSSVTALAKRLGGLALPARRPGRLGPDAVAAARRESAPAPMAVADRAVRRARLPARAARPWSPGARRRRSHPRPIFFFFFFFFRSPRSLRTPPRRASRTRRPLGTPRRWRRPPCRARDLVLQARGGGRPARGQRVERSGRGGRFGHRSGPARGGARASQAREQPPRCRRHALELPQRCVDLAHRARPRLSARSCWRLRPRCRSSWRWLGPSAG